jgi:hypothetical protein
MDDGIVKVKMLSSEAPETISRASDVLENISFSFSFYLLCEAGFSTLAVLETAERDRLGTGNAASCSFVLQDIEFWSLWRKKVPSVSLY